ncbi:hypothetical protein B4O97_06375 [Marispirochaeta aestuarii]|uniref:Dihydrolipoamide acetyltransferase component of pyruvate dehydrogenase complex n=1 Tax=Marispirochaeta aestuarii TaxID=1963862 RepID=A0A1Y1RZE9_9SPIO|nr:dihydrolipoamide acetyltransferase family protein [Marispirochaeta aestuarii]ORC36213.1 hypothetical protein B4O97_06375 [Marispirochaeta aestuarii]
MAEFVRMPQKGLTEESALLSEWHVREGDLVRPGQLLFSLETGKAVFDVEAESAGTVLKLLAAPGDEVPIKDAVLVIGEPGEEFSIEKTPAAPQSGAKPLPVPAEHPADRSSRVTEFPGAGGRGRRISPRARNLAEKHGIAVNDIKGSGPGGRIIVDDIRRLMTAAAPPRPDNDMGGQRLPVTGMRKVIAERLSGSFFTAPHIFLRAAVSVDRLMELREGISSETGTKISLNAFFMKLSAEALKRHPRLNSSWKESYIEIHDTADIGLAVSLEDGLITPVVRNCGSKGIIQIDGELKELIEKARQGRLQPEEYQEAGFTISNLGSYEVEEFTAIINPPASAILALGRAGKETVVNGDDSVEIRRMMRTTLSCDHRAIDGAVAAAFLTDLKRMIQDPARALL